eukprot:232889_1
MKITVLLEPKYEDVNQQRTTSHEQSVNIVICDVWVISDQECICEYTCWTAAQSFAPKLQSNCHCDSLNLKATWKPVTVHVIHDMHMNLLRWCKYDKRQLMITYDSNHHQTKRQTTH